MRGGLDLLLLRCARGRGFGGLAGTQLAERLLDLGHRQEPSVGRDVAAVEDVDALAGHPDLGQAHAVASPDQRDAARPDAELADRSRLRAIQTFVPASTREGSSPES